MSSSLVSIIIPTYNRVHLLGNAVESALSQKDVDVEVIVVDDGSSDGTSEMLVTKGYPIRYYFQPNRGTAAARNLGLTVCKGDFVVFLDSDDIILPNKCASQRSILTSESKYSIVYSQWIKEVDGAQSKIVGMDHTHHIIPTILYKPITAIHACMFSSSALTAVGGFDESIKGVEDWDLFIRLALLGHRFAFLLGPTAVYRFHGANMSYKRDEMLNNAMRLVDKTFVEGELPSRLKSVYPLVRIMQFLETLRRSSMMNEYEYVDLIENLMSGEIQRCVSDDKISYDIRRVVELAGRSIGSYRDIDTINAARILVEDCIESIAG